MAADKTKEEYIEALREQQNTIREIVFAGIDQVKEGKTKDFDEVCDRLEKKYRDLGVDN